MGKPMNSHVATPWNPCPPHPQMTSLRPQVPALAVDRAVGMSQEPPGTDRKHMKKHMEKDLNSYSIHIFTTTIVDSCFQDTFSILRFDAGLYNGIQWGISWDSLEIQLFNGNMIYFSMLFSVRVRFCFYDLFGSPYSNNFLCSLEAFGAICVCSERQGQYSGTKYHVMSKLDE